MAVDESRSFTIQNPSLSWWDLLKEWWRTLPTWQKTLILVGGASSIAGSVYYITKEDTNYG